MPRWPTPPLTPVGARYSPNTSRRAPAHSPVVPPAWARAMVAGMMFSVPSAARFSSSRARWTGGRVAGGPPCLHVGTQLGLDRGVDPQDGAARPAVAARTGALGLEGRFGRLGEAVDPDHLQLAGLDAPDPLGLAAHQPRLQLVDGLEGAAQLEHVLQLGPRRLGHLVGLLLDDHRAVEDVAVLEQVRLEGQDLLDAQRPLLVPGPGQPERLVPGRQLHGPGPGPFGQRHPERLEDDAGNVVLRLGLGQPERVDLDAVAEPPELGLGDPVPFGAHPFPQLGEGPHLAGLLDESAPRR